MKKLMNVLLLSIIAFMFMINSVSAAELNCDGLLLSRGSRGDDVSTLQTMLNEKMSCGLEVDGIFGINTYNCTRSYQAENGLEVDGIVGINTCTALNSTDIESIEGQNVGVVTGKKVNIRKEASLKSDVIDTVSRGKQLEILGEEDGWFKVKYEDREAFISKLYFKNTVILVDISDQYLYQYVDGQTRLVAPIVTGVKGKHDTPRGSYKLRVKNLRRDVTLRGYNDDGSKYASFVSYWMPFADGNAIGFHDATWRDESEFTATRFIESGSHGCVNMKYNDAENLFNSIDKDVNVVVRN